MHAIINSTIIYVFSRFFVSIYTNDENLLNAADGALQFFAFFALLDGNKGNGTGILRGIGLLKPLSLMVFISYYIISPPL